MGQLARRGILIVQPIQLVLLHLSVSEELIIQLLINVKLHQIIRVQTRLIPTTQQPLVVKKRQYVLMVLTIQHMINVYLCLIQRATLLMDILTIQLDHDARKILHYVLPDRITTQPQIVVKGRARVLLLRFGIVLRSSVRVAGLQATPPRQQPQVA